MDKLIALKIKCPKCGTSLMDPYHLVKDKPSVHLEIEVNGEKGDIHLCSYYGCTDHNSSINVEEGAKTDFSCPSCHEKLVNTKLCEECDTPMVPLQMEKGGRIYMCAKKGCNQHFLEFSNVSDALRKMYNEYGYF